MKLFSIPNLITLCNLLCGCLAIVFAFDGNLVWSAYLVGIAAVLDFLDGFVARALKQYSPIGKDLDSLADMVTFGVVPGVVMFKLIQIAILSKSISFGIFGSGLEYVHNWNKSEMPVWSDWQLMMPFIAFLIPLFSALRLAKFNNDTRQSDSFIGIPTPANSILICSLPLILYYIDAHSSDVIVGFDLKIFNLIHSDTFLVATTCIMSFLLISEIPLFSLKFKKFGWKGNEIRYVFLALCLAMIVILKFIAMPLIIVLYILMSLVNNMVKSKPQSHGGTE